MIIIEDKTILNTIQFPKNTDGTPSKLKLYSELTHYSADFDVEELGTSSMFFTFSLDFSNVSVGEYIYTISDASHNVLSSGYLRIGNFDSLDIIYDYGESYTTYDPETGESEVVSPYCLTDVSAQVTQNGSMTIQTPDGYDGISRVNLTVNVEGGGGAVYSAGTNIDITNNVISVTGITVPTKVSQLTNDKSYTTSGEVQTSISNQHFKTINGQTIKGDGNIVISSGKTYEGGRNITIDSNGVISCTLTDSTLTNIKVLTQAQYDAIETKNNTTMYVIKG